MRHRLNGDNHSCGSDVTNQFYPRNVQHVFLIQMAYDEYVMRTISLKFPFCETVEVNIFEIGRHLIKTLCTAFDHFLQHEVADCDSC